MIEARYIDVDGALAYVELTGDGPPVLCLHTAGQSGVQWRHVIEDLAAAGYRVVVPDLPGHGRSEPAPGGPVSDLGVYGRWCLALIGALGLHRPYVVGCSIGGKIALDVAVRASPELSGVVAMAADARNTGLRVKGLQRELEDVAAPSRTDRTYFGTLAVVGRSVPAERAELIATMHRREDPAVSTSDLIGWVKDDLWLDAEQVRWAAGEIPGARFTLLEGIGHYPMEEVDGFGDVLAGWLTELSAKAVA